jgi:hypothetical protein
VPGSSASADIAELHVCSHGGYLGDKPAPKNICMKPTPELLMALSGISAML